MFGPCAMKVITQLVLIVMPSFIRTEANKGNSSTSGNGVGSLSEAKNFEPSSYERDLVIDAIKAADYPAEAHVVTTSDGYILKLHRIPDPALQEDNSEEQLYFNHLAEFRGVVLLMHGIFSTAADFIVTGPENGLAFVLADAGYDVWMANARGTRFSRQNQRISPKMAEFWDFSWNEIGTGDLPAIIDYILGQTRQRKLFYVGHNQGVTALLVLLSQKPKYNRKIAGAAGMAPVAYLDVNGNNEIIKILAKFNDQLWVTFNALNIFELTPTESIFKFLGNIICSEEAMTADACSELLAGIFGRTIEETKHLLPDILDNLATGVSTKQLIHYGQLMQSGKFQQFDYKNFFTNFQRYKQGKPPEYNLSSVSVPFSLFYGTKDMLTSTMDFRNLVKTLPDVRTYDELLGWTHLDFIYNPHVYLKVYSKIIESFQQ